MKVLFLTKYHEKAASSRLRSIQYVPYLRDHGIDVTVEPLFGPGYLDAFYATGKKPFGAAVAAYGGRLCALLRAPHFDLVWVEKEALPYVPWFLEKVGMSRIRYVVDYDDAVFHIYDQHKSRWVRTVLGEKIDRVIANAEAVVVGNDYLAAKAKLSGARRIFSLPTVVDTARYRMDLGMHADFVIGWIGTPYTSKYLELIREQLALFCRASGSRILAVGADPKHLEGLPATVEPWSADTEVEAIGRMDVGIMPLPDRPFEVGKCGYKLIQYLACGKPVIASAVGANRKIVRHGENGFLVERASDWTEHMLTLFRDIDSRRRMGLAGRKMVEGEYSLQVAAPRLLDILTSFQ